MGYAACTKRVKPGNFPVLTQSAIVSIEVFVQRAAGASINWPSNIKWSSANLTATSFSAPSASRLDTYLLVYLPNLGYWIGHIVAQGYGTPGT